MARGAASAQRKQRPKPDPKRSKSAPSWEEQLFFSRLRRHAKVIYVLLALVFVFSFVLLGVGSGSNGISDALQNFFGQNNGSSIGSQINDKQQAVERHPQDVNLYLDLAGLYQSDNQEAKALVTLRKAQRVAPKNIDVLTRIASIYGAQAGREGDNYRNVLAVYSQNVTTPPGLDTSSQIGQALTSDPYSQALQTQLNTAYTKVTTAYQRVAAVYKHAAQIARGTSNEPNSLLQWASAAQSANDYASAITAYQRFLKVAPDNPNAAAVRQTLGQLQAAVGAPQG
jgi:cytochrome c-type biogenesis protein CcmH/NrfG